jgi:hypothetical protein
MKKIFNSLDSVSKDPNWGPVLAASLYTVAIILVGIISAHC